jgi:hypothetical protein
VTLKASSQALYDSHSLLRLVDAAIEDLGIVAADAGSAAGGSPDDAASEVTQIIADVTLAVRLEEVAASHAYAYARVVGILRRLREGRATIERIAAERFSPAGEKLRVIDANGLAATDVLAGIEEALAMVDVLEERTALSDTGAAVRIHADLRDRLLGLMNQLRFQDITRRQLSRASAVLLEAEHHLGQLAAGIEPTVTALSTGAPVTSTAGDPGGSRPS